MNKSFSVILIAGSLLVLDGCKKESNELKGDWAIDLAPMIEHAKSSGASEAEIAKMKEDFTGGRMAIDEHNIRFSVEGISTSATVEYTVLSKDGNCFNISTKLSTTPARYCVIDSGLEVHDPNMGTALYKKQ